MCGCFLSKKCSLYGLVVCVLLLAGLFAYVVLDQLKAILNQETDIEADLDLADGLRENKMNQEWRAADEASSSDLPVPMKRLSVLGDLEVNKADEDGHVTLQPSIGNIDQETLHTIYTVVYVTVLIAFFAFMIREFIRSLRVKDPRGFRTKEDTDIYEVYV